MTCVVLFYDLNNLPCEYAARVFSPVYAVKLFLRVVVHCGGGKYLVGLKLSFIYFECYLQHTRDWLLIE